MNLRMHSGIVGGAATAFAVLALAGPSDALGQTRTWTTNADFDEGVKVNVNYDVPDQLQLNEETAPFPFINVAASARGTIIRINTETGEIIGEYKTACSGRGLNPSRTTVDLYGNVWAGNRNEADGGLGSVVKIGLVVGGTRVDADGVPDPTGAYLAPPFAYSTAVDRDGDGLIKTSKGVGDILPWPDVTDGAGGGSGGLAALVEDADDECILVYQRVHGNNIRHVSVDANNNVWTGGHVGGDNTFDLLDGDDGTILATFDVGMGGYGGLVDGNGVLWSSSRTPFGLLRYDPKGTITTADDTFDTLLGPDAYGLGIDTFGNIWHSQYSTNVINKWTPDGMTVATFPTFGASGDRGVVVTPADDDVWVANSWGSDVSRLANDGTWLKTIPLGTDGVGPTGLAVDAEGKVWVTCLTSSTAKRIDPAGDVDGLGAVDLTVDLGADAGPYNYSDMTGSVLLQVVQQGTWNVIHDTGVPGLPTATLFWNSDEPMTTSLIVEVRAADSPADLGGETFVPVMDGVPTVGLSGRYWEIRVTFGRDTGAFDTPVLYDLTFVGLIEGFLDIKPGSCPNSFNPRSKGKTPVALVGTDDFFVMDVDPATLLLTRADGVGGMVAPLRWTYADVATPFMGMPCDCHEMGPDGIMDLSLHFSTPEIVNMLLLDAEMPGSMVELVLSGFFTDGTPFEAYDCVRIVPRKK